MVFLGSGLHRASSFGRVHKMDTSQNKTSSLRFTRFSAVALFCALPACGDSGPPGMGETTNDPLQPGVIVDCDPEADPPLDKVCMEETDFMCPLQGHYTREGLCAYVLGGTPGDYDGKPKLVPYDKMSEIDCANLKEGVRSAWGLTPGGCSPCTECGIQRGGEELYEPGAPNPAGWDELNGLGPHVCPNGEFPISCEDAVPTTSAGDDTGAESSTGDTPPESVWVCNGSTGISGFIDITEEKWMSGGNIPHCRTASDVADARAECKTLCEDIDDYWNDYATDNSHTWSGFDCDYFDDSEPPPFELGPNDDLDLFCLGGGPMDIPIPLTPFTGSAGLTFSGGAAIASDWLGAMEFTVLQPCTSLDTTCELSITEVYALGGGVTGVYDDGSATLQFSISDPEIRLLQPVMGTWYRGTEVVSFPDDDFFIAVSAGPTSVGTVTVNSGFENVVFLVESPDASFDGVELSLGFEWQQYGLELLIYADAQ